ncbi:MAG: sigma 54-interacting transcriptional regulator [Candidatus Zixiibacteriota bacterium]|nr:MAG: sigma 54-interacting transcriptional regulator [candidate division Zixibacteria bacterium]
MAEQTNIEQLQATLEELKNINRIVDKISRVRETNHIMSIVVEELVRLTGSDQGVINLVSPTDQSDLLTVIRTGEVKEGDVPYKLANNLSGWVLRNKRALRIDDLDTDKRFAGLSSEDGKYKSMLCCPMIARGQVIGLLSLIRGRDNVPFTEDQTRMVGIAASQSAQILSNALLLEELAGKNKLLELTQGQLRDENARLREEVGTTFAFENIIGKSPAMRSVLSLASRVSTNDSPVLIEGETGTGKELLARAIHHNSPRKDKPFVVKNCGVKTESLLESELFGHVKGAFTGAVQDKPGLFREADGGTIFLDEVGDAPLGTQVAILRVLENGEIRPVGASKSEHVNVRILSATNRDLKEFINEGKFRQDLFYRLNAFTLSLPPLRERHGDIPLLTHSFLEKLRIKLANNDLKISSAALDVLNRYSWPGNVRQLEHEIERAAVVCSIGGEIDVPHLSPDVLGSTADEIDSAGYRGRLREIVERVERDVITAALAENDSNILRTSKILGLTRKGLKDKIARYGISTDKD